MVWSHFYFTRTFDISTTRLANGIDGVIYSWYGYVIFICIFNETDYTTMNDFWQIVTTTQATFALTLIAVALILIAVKLFERGTPRSSR